MNVHLDLPSHTLIKPKMMNVFCSLAAFFAAVVLGAPSVLELGGGTSVTVSEVGAVCTLRVDVPAKRAGPACRLRIRTQPVDDGSLFGNSDAPEFAFLWRFGSAVFSEAQHNLGKLAGTSDRDASAPCPQAGSYYLGAKLLECGGAGKTVCSAVISAYVDHLAAITIDVGGNMQTSHVLTSLERGIDLYVQMDAAKQRSSLALDIETIGTSFVGAYTVLYRPSHLLMFKDEAKADGLSRRYQIGPLEDGQYVVRVAAISAGDIIFSVKVAYGTSADGINYPTAVCARPACAALPGCADCTVNGCKWCGTMCAAATSTTPICVDTCSAAGGTPSAGACAALTSCAPCAAKSGCVYCGGGNCIAGAQCPDSSPPQQCSATPDDGATKSAAAPAPATTASAVAAVMVLAAMHM